MLPSSAPSPFASALVLIASLLACGQPAAEKPSSAAEGPPSEASKEVDPELRDRCGRSVRHITTLLVSGPGSFRVSQNEAAIMEVTTAMSIATCEGEGLSPAQEACVLAVEDIQELGAVAECPAIAERRPSWLLLPPTEAQEAELRKALAASSETPTTSG